MRLLLIVTLFFTSFFSLGQTSQIKVFKKTIYSHSRNSVIDRQIFNSVKIIGEKLDLYFYERHFGNPYQLPEKFIDSQYKSQSITVWRDTTKKDDFESNSKHVYTYNNLGRLTQYSWSGCMVCASMQYQFNVNYNKSGQVSAISKANDETAFKFYYNLKGDIVKYEKFFFGNLESVVDLLN